MQIYEVHIVKVDGKLNKHSVSKQSYFIFIFIHRYWYDNTIQYCTTIA